jgi:hypothetical protein
MVECVADGELAPVATDAPTRRTSEYRAIVSPLGLSAHAGRAKLVAQFPGDGIPSMRHRRIALLITSERMVSPPAASR